LLRKTAFIIRAIFFKVYGNEHTHHAIVGVDEKTFRKWSWTYIYLLADLPTVSHNEIITKYFQSNHRNRLIFQEDLMMQKMMPTSLYL
jgi:hypothetical protein